MKEDKNKEIGQRIQIARKAAGFDSATQAALSLGVNYRTYAGHENGNRNAINFLSAYSKKFKVSVDWLLTGKGNMGLRNEGSGDIKNKGGITNVPLVAWVSAGQMEGHDSIDNLSNLRTIPVYALPKGEWIALRVDGQSMNQISPHDSIILVNMQEIDLIPNACYVIADETGQATYKRYRPNEIPVFQPYSYQKIDPPKLEGTVRVIGRVRRTITDM